MNPPVHCLNCGTSQSWDDAHWGIGPQCRRASFTCRTCGWLVEAKAQTWEFMLAQMKD